MANKYGATADRKREAIKTAGYKYIKCLGHGRHLLYNHTPVYGGAFEIWRTNKNDPGYGLIYKNTVLVFERRALDRWADGGY